MAKIIEQEIKFKGSPGVLNMLGIEASKLDDIINRIIKSAERAYGGIRKLASASIVADASMHAISELNNVVGNLVAPYNSFESAMRKANTMALKSEDGFKQLTDQISDLSKNISLAREELADGLYQVISNGVPEDNWISFLEDSSKAAVGGVADLGQTVTVTSTMIKNYGLEWSAAGEIQNKIQTTARNGVTTFEQLGQALPRVSGSAAQLGVEIDELMATFATATGVTGNTSEVSTQLAAVLNSLIKPTSEATRAADAMGIRFDAASIKACGGFKNFLIELDAAVTEYAQKSGQLSETIYGQLFGSAEALRLLGSLTGEQKDKFAENIGAMCDSAGAVNEAYAQVTSTGVSISTMMTNKLQSFLDWIGALVSSKAPILELCSNMGMALIGMTQMCKLIGTLISTTKEWNVATYASKAAQMAVAVATKVWTVATAALNAVLSLNPVGIVIIAIGALVAALLLAYNRCEGFRNVCDRVWSIVKVMAAAIWNHLITAFENASKVIQTAWEWVKKFFGISDAESASKVAGALDKQTSSTEELTKANEGLVNSGLKLGESVEWQKMSYEQLGEAIERQKTKVAEAAGVNAAKAKQEGETLRQMEARYKALGKQYGLSSDSKGSEYDGKRLILNAASFKELGNNITYYQNALDKTDPAEVAEIERLSRLIAGLKDAQEEIKNLQDSFSQPLQLDSISDVEKAIQYQQDLRSKAPTADIGKYDAEIRRLESLRDAMELGSYSPVPVEEITTMRELNAQREYYNRLYETADAAGRAHCREELARLETVEAGWRRMEVLLREPVEVGAIGSVGELERAIEICEERIQWGTAEEAKAWGKAKRAYEAKRDAMRRGVDAGAFDAEARSISAISRNVAILKERLEHVGSVEAAGMINREIARWERKGEAMRNAGKDAEGYAQTMEKVGMVMRAVGDVTGGAAKSWLSYGANVMSTLGTVIPEMIKLLGLDQAISMAEAIKSGAGVPFPGNIFAIAAGVAAVVGAFAGVPKFADGGIAYGPTLGLFGEYAGARRNPEVVAPLDRLKALIGPGAGGGEAGAGGVIELRMKERELRGVLRKGARARSRG